MRTLYVSLTNGHFTNATLIRRTMLTCLSMKVVLMTHEVILQQKRILLSPYRLLL